jgi:hypothetical protein
MDAVSKKLVYSLYFLLATLGVTIGVPIFMLITGQADMPSTIISLVSGLGAFGAFFSVLDYIFEHFLVSVTWQGLAFLRCHVGIG